MTCSEMGIGGRFGDTLDGGTSNGYGVGIRVEDTGGGIWPIGGGGNGGAGTSKSGGNAGTSVIRGGPRLLILVDNGRSGLPTPGAVFA